MSDEERNCGEILGIPFISGTPKIILQEIHDKSSTTRGLNINISEDVLKHKQIGYTTSIDTLKFILENRTIRSSSLNNANLNDRMEMKRNGVEQYAGSKFITCFTHMESECIPFWAYYGGNIKERKIQLVFDNFFANFEGLFYLDYLVKDNDKVFFFTDEYKRTINNNGTIGQKAGLPLINTDYDISNAVKSVSIFDVDYRKPDDEIFTNMYSGIGTVNFDRSSGLYFNNGSVQVEQYDISSLGKQKSEPWSYEQETRIMLSLENTINLKWNYLDLRFKDELFRNMRIIMSPWINEDAYDDLRILIQNWNISNEIKDTIKIQRSVVTGTLNLG